MYQKSIIFNGMEILMQQMMKLITRSYKNQIDNEIPEYYIP